MNADMHCGYHPSSSELECIESTNLIHHKDNVHSVEITKATKS